MISICSDTDANRIGQAALICLDALRLQLLLTFEFINRSVDPLDDGVHHMLVLELHENLQANLVGLAE